MTEAKRRRTLSLSMTVLFIVAGFSVAASAIIGIIMSSQSVARMKQTVNNKMLEIVTTASAMLDGDSLVGLKATDVDTPAYQDCYEILSDFRRSNEGTSGEIAFIYCCRSIGNDEFEFTIDPSEDPAAFGEKIDTTEGMRIANQGTPAVDDAPFTDRWGTFYSAYAPVFTSNHEVAMLVGVDVWAKWYDSMIWSNTGAIIIASAVAATAGIMAGVIINMHIRNRFRVLSDDFSALEGDIQTLISEVSEPMNLPAPTASSSDQSAYLHEQIQITQKQIKDYINYAKKQAYFDGLCHCGNRTAYLEFIRPIELLPSLCVVVMDINGLKYINDHFGHEIGDKAIVDIARALMTAFKPEEVFRIGGDEFAIVVQDTHKEEIEAGIARFNAIIDNENKNKNFPFVLCASSGYAFFDSSVDKSYVDLFRRADDAMYKNKEEFYDKNPELKAKYRR